MELRLGKGGLAHQGDASPFPLGRHSHCPGSSPGMAPPQHHTGGKDRAVSCVSVCMHVCVMCVTRVTHVMCVTCDV